MIISNSFSNFDASNKLEPTVTLDPYKGATVVSLGDSITVVKGYAYSLANQLPGILRFGGNLGYAGRRTDEIYGYLDNALALNPTVLVVCVGANDVIQGRTPSSVLPYIDLMVKRTRDAGVMIVFLLTPPGNVGNQTASAQLNMAIARRCSQLGVICVDGFSSMRNPTDGTTIPSTSSDGLHPNYEALNLAGIALANAIGPKLEPYVRTNDIWTNCNAGDGGILSNPLNLLDSNADGVANQWTVPTGSVSASIISGAPNGGNWQRYTATNLANIVNYNSYFGQSIVGGKTYFYSGYARMVGASPNPNHLQGSITMVFRNGGGYVGGAVLYDQGILLTPDIHQFSGYFTVPANANNFYMTVTMAVEPAQNYPVSGSFDWTGIQIWDLTALGV